MIYLDNYCFRIIIFEKNKNHVDAMPNNSTANRYVIYTYTLGLLYNYGSLRIIRSQAENSIEDKGNSLNLNSRTIAVEDYCFNYSIPHFTNFSLSFKM